MITFLDGRLVNALPTQAIVDVRGVGYEVFIPLSSYDKLPAPGESVALQVSPTMPTGTGRQILWISLATPATSLADLGSPPLQLASTAP